VLHDYHHRSSGRRQRGCPRQRQHSGLPHHRQRRRQRRKDRERIERLHLLPGQVRMSNHSSRRPFVPHTIHRLAVPILLFWVALAAVPNILVPQLEEVGRLHNVGLSSPGRPRSRSAPTPTSSMTRWFTSWNRTRSTFSTSRTSGETR